MKLLVLALFAWACVPPPTYVTRSGVLVYDPNHFSNADEIQRWIDLTIEHAPPDPTRVLEFADRLNGATLTINPDIETTSPCRYVVPEGKVPVGCTVASEKDMEIDLRPCSDNQPSAGILAHEIGHLMGYGHGYGPWFAGDRMEWLIDALVCPKP